MFIFAQIEDMANQQPGSRGSSKMKMWFKRVGIGGLIFFTLKGIVWLFVFYFGACFRNALRSRIHTEIIYSKTFSNALRAEPRK